MQQKYTFGKTKLLTIFHYSQCCVGHDASLQVRHDVTEPNLGPLACTQERQSTDTSCVVKESTVFTAGHQVRRTGSSSSKDPNFPMVFWEGVLKAVWARRLQGVWSAHAQFSARLALRWSFKHHRHSGFNKSRVYVLVINIFHLRERGSISYKSNLEMWSLSTSFRELWVHWLCSVAEWQPKLLPISQPNSYALFLCLHISLSIILESAFWDPSLGRLKQKLSTSKNRDTGLAYGSSSLFPLILFSLEGNTFRKEKRIKFRMQRLIINSAEELNFKGTWFQW